MKNIGFILLSFCFPLLLFSQTQSGNIEDYIAAKITNAPSSSGNDYLVPTDAQLQAWNTVVGFILSEDIASARSNVSALNYQVTEFTDTFINPNQIFYILEEKSSQTNYWGTYVFSKTPTRNNLIIQAPHSKYDTNTGSEAVYCFKNLLARVLMINGTHRCNNSNFSTCSGTTSACGSSTSFQVSDLAHTTFSVFQKTTETIFTTISNSVFIQLHGFGKKSTDPYIILSNGTRETPSIDYALLLQDALFAEDNNLTFKLAHKDLNWTRLIGFTNTQGRLINNSTDFCNTSAVTTSGRFIHVEQEKSKLRNDITGWNKMSSALANVFSSTLNIDEFNLRNQISIAPNPTAEKIIIKGKEILVVKIMDVLGKEILRLNNKSKNNEVAIHLKNQFKGLYLVKVYTSKKTVTKKIILK